MIERSYHKQGPRIPIRKWEKVTDRYGWRGEDEYRLEVLINGELLGVDVRVPNYLAVKDKEALREHIINSLAHQIGAVIADEVRRSIV